MSAPPRPPLLHAHGLVPRGAARGAAGLDLVWHHGETLGLVTVEAAAADGLVRALVGLEHAARGSVRVCGRELRRPDRRVQLLHADPRAALDERRSAGSAVREVLALARLGRTPALRGERAIDALGDAGLRPAQRYLGLRPADLDDAECQRLVIACALALEVEGLVVDVRGPAAMPTARAAVLELLHELRTAYSLGVLLVADDIALAAGESGRLAVLHDGAIVEAGETATVLAAPAHDVTRALLAAGPLAA
jgi:peptide/nickel transport system ATP-binding protein